MNKVIQTFLSLAVLCFVVVYGKNDVPKIKQKPILQIPPGISETLLSNYTLNEILNFRSFKSIFNKTYPTVAAESQALLNFLKNQRDILVHNENFKKGLTTFVRGVCEYSDLSVYDFNLMINRFILVDEKNLQKRAVKNTKEESDEVEGKLTKKVETEEDNGTEDIVEEPRIEDAEEDPRIADIEEDPDTFKDPDTQIDPETQQNPETEEFEEDLDPEDEKLSLNEIPEKKDEKRLQIDDPESIEVQKSIEIDNDDLVDKFDIEETAQSEDVALNKDEGLKDEQQVDDSKVEKSVDQEKKTNLDKTVTDSKEKGENDSDPDQTIDEDDPDEFIEPELEDIGEDPVDLEEGPRNGPEETVKQKESNDTEPNTADLESEEDESDGNTAKSQKEKLTETKLDQDNETKYSNIKTDKTIQFANLEDIETINQDLEIKLPNRNNLEDIQDEPELKQIDEKSQDDYDINPEIGLEDHPVQIPPDDIQDLLNLESTKNLPGDVSLNYANWLINPVQNQGICASGWSFAAVAAIEAALFLKTGKLIKLSEQQLIDCDRSSINQGCSGGNLASAFEFIKKNGGIALDDKYPYVGNGSNGCLDVDPAVQIVSHKIVETSDENLLLEALKTHGPVAVGIDASLGSFQSYRSGIYYDPECSRRINHVLLLVGYGTTKDTNQDFWILKNSYGESWGSKGFLKLVRNRNNHCGIAEFAVYPIIKVTNAEA